MRFFDGLFNKNSIWTILMSGFIGILIYAAFSQEQFVDEVSQYVDNEQYFEQLEEVKQAMLKEEYDLVPDLIEKAKTLKESE